MYIYIYIYTYIHIYTFIYMLPRGQGRVLDAAVHDGVETWARDPCTICRHDLCALRGCRERDRILYGAAEATEGAE